MHSGWSRGRALAYNTLSAFTFLAGGLLAYAASATVDVSLLLPFAAGNFVYIALADLVPELRAGTAARTRLVSLAMVTIGLAVMLAPALRNR